MKQLLCVFLDLWWIQKDKLPLTQFMSEHSENNSEQLGTEHSEGLYKSFKCIPFNLPRIVMQTSQLIFVALK